MRNRKSTRGLSTFGGGGEGGERLYNENIEEKKGHADGKGREREEKRGKKDGRSVLRTPAF